MTRSLFGILVHGIALFTGFIGAGLVYVVSDNEFTKANARNALNWHVSVFALFLVALTLFILGADDVTILTYEFDAILPEPLGLIVFLIGAVVLAIAILAAFLTIVFALIATGKAIAGTAWGYPFARSFVGSE